MRSRQLWWVAVWPVWLALACETGDPTAPRIGFALDNAALRDDIRELRLQAFRNTSLACDGHALSGTPTAAAAVDLPVVPTQRTVNFPAEAGDWLFYVTAGNDDFPIAGPKRLAEGCRAERIDAGTSPEIQLEIHDLRPEYCGDLILDPGEDCDRGPDVPDDDCDPQCLFEAGVCGNGRVDSSETCDDHNTDPGDGCASNCQTEIFMVNVRYHVADQTQPRVAAGRDSEGNGGFAVVWTDRSGGSGADTMPPGVMICFFDETGKPTQNPTGGLFEYMLNPHVQTGSQRWASVGWGHSGYLATFVDEHAGDFDAYAMAYGTTRAARWSDERHVPSSWSGVSELQSVVGSHPDRDGFVVAWTTEGTVPSSREVMVRVFDGTGEPLTADVPVGAAVTQDQFLPAVAMKADGSFAVAWVEGTTDTTIRLARFSAAGAPAGDPEALPTTEAGNQSEPGLAYDATGRLLVVWTDAITASIRGRLLPVTGPAENDFAVSVAPLLVGTVESGRLVTSVGSASDTFLVVWGSQSDSRVAARLVTGVNVFGSNRVTGDLGEFPIAGATQPNRARVAVTPNGVALVVWQDLDDLGGTDPSGGIRGRILPVP